MKSNLFIPPDAEPLLMEPGIYPDMPRTDYDRLPYLNRTTLVQWLKMKRVPQEFLWHCGARWSEPRDSEALNLGQALDTLTLEPREWDKRFVIIPGNAPRKPSDRQRFAKKPSADSIAAVEWWDEFNAAAETKIVLTQEQHTRALKMSEALQNDPDIAEIAKHCRKAVLIGDMWGFRCKAEIDWWTLITEYVFDLKSSADFITFGESATKFGYLFQVEFYTNLARALDAQKTAFGFVVVKSSPPYTAGIQRVSPDNDEHAKLLATARKSLMDGAETLRWHLEKNEWPGWVNYLNVSFPGYAKWRLEL